MTTDQYLPQWLNKEAWAEWVQFRKEIRKPLKPTTIKLQLKMLEKHKENHVEILETSIQNGWQGLFPNKARSYPQKEVEVGSISWQMAQEAKQREGIIDVQIENS